MEVPAESKVNTSPVVGVDVGIKEAAIVSSGRRFENQKPLSKQVKKLKRLQRSLSRKEYDSQSKLEREASRIGSRSASRSRPG